MRSDLPVRTAPASRAFSGSQVRAPGDHPHVECERVAGETRAEAAEAYDAKRFASEVYADRHAALEASGAHGVVGHGNRAGGGDHEPKREFRCRIKSLAARCVAYRHPLARARLDIHHGVRGARDADHAELREAADQSLGKGGALAHGQENVEIFQRAGGLVLRTESIGKKHKLRSSGKSRPVGALSRHVLPIIENRNLHHFCSHAAAERVIQKQRKPSTGDFGRRRLGVFVDVSERCGG